jgi:flagellar biosynthesis/type III secretory pathway protein FliH
MTIENKDYLGIKQKLMEKSLNEEAYAKLTRKEKSSYQLSLKVDRDLMNSYATAYKLGYERGFKEGLAQGKLEVELEVAS